MNLPVIPRIKSVTDLRYQTAEIIKLVQQNQPVVVTKDSNTVAVLLSPIQYQTILDMVEELEDQKAAKKLEKAISIGGTFSGFQTYDRKRRKKLR
jgi:prevent-host-death family protein